MRAIDAFESVTTKMTDRHMTTVVFIWEVTASAEQIPRI
jgi:hypothetical protein